MKHAKPVTHRNTHTSKLNSGSHISNIGGTTSEGELLHKVHVILNQIPTHTIKTLT